MSELKDKFIAGTDEMTYEEFTDKAESFLDGFPSVKDFFESIVAASALLGRNVTYQLERSIEKNIEGSWNDQMLTKIFQSDNVLTYNYKFGFIEQPDENDMMMGDSILQLKMYFNLIPNNNMHDFAIIVSCNEPEDSARAIEMKDFFDNAETIFQANNTCLEGKEFNDEEYGQELVLVGFTMPNAAAENLMGLYMHMRYIEDPASKQDPLSSI